MLLKFRLPAALLFSLFVSLLSAQTLTETNLPILLIETNGGSIQNDVKIKAELRVVDNGPGQLNHPGDPANGYDGNIGIEYRGSTSLFYDKKPYNIETQKADGTSKTVSLLGMPEESDWALISPLNDKSLMRDALAYKFAAATMDWSPRFRYVEVMLNGSYEGIYMLLEKIKRGKDRVDISKLKDVDLAGDSLTGGYILKMDKLNGWAGGDWASPFPPFLGATATTYFQIHYPKIENIKSEQRTYIENAITTFEQSLNNWTPNSPGLPPYDLWLDSDSWIDYLLVNEISKNVDGYRLSAYFYKDRDSKDGGLIHMGPVWDFNISFGIGDYCDGNSPQGWMKNFNQICPQDGWVIHFWWEKLLRDTIFQERVAQRWASLRAGVWSDAALMNCVDSLSTLLSDAQVRNFQRWPVLGQYVWPNAFIGPTWQSEVDFLKTWLQSRVAWMDDNIHAVGPSVPQVTPPYISNARIFPNPLRQGEKLILEYTTQGRSDAKIRIFDALGRQVIKSMPLPLGPVHFELELPSLGAGLYFYEIYFPDTVVKKGKFEIF